MPVPTGIGFGGAGASGARTVVLTRPGVPPAPSRKRQGERGLVSRTRKNLQVRRLPPTGGAPILGIAFGAASVFIASAALVPVRAHVTRATPALVLVLAVVAAGLVGGSLAAVVTAVVAAAAYNLVFIPPF